MRFSSIFLSILPLAITSLALPTSADALALAARQSVIIPGPVTQPAGSTLVQVGFNSPYNWGFVSRNPQAQAQIFDFLPQGIAHGLGISTSSVVVKELRSLDTSASLGYVTTLARFYIPSGQVNALQAGLLNQGSKFYDNPTAIINSIMEQINHSVSVIVD